MPERGLGPDERARVGESLVGERRLVTILFCDLVGSTTMSQRLDPEDYAELVLAYQERGRDVIERHGGIVANYQGDGLVAQFGYPEAHENDAERAVLSGLQIVEVVDELNRSRGEALGETIQCRVGAHASVSVVGRMGTDRSDMSIFGDTANIASRVEGVAAPGQVVVTRPVLDLLRGEYESGDHRQVELKGVPAPVEVARILGPATTVSTAAPKLYVGRSDLLEEIRRSWAQVEAGTGVAITISAPAGIGKSALVRAFLDSAGSPVTLLARGRSLNEAESFGVLQQLATGCRDHTDRGIASAARHALDEVARPGDAGTTAQTRWQRAFDAGLDFLRAVAASPTVVVVEDLHWTDASTLQLLERFTTTIAGHPALLLATTRSETPLGDSNLLELAPLDDDALRALVEAAGEGDLADPIVADIVRRAQGVPLFAVELAQGARVNQTVALPESLQASLLARLAPRPHLTRVAQAASVLGDQVDVPLLATLLGSDREELDGQVEMLEELHVLEPTPGVSWHFVHSLLREALYGSMLRNDRRSLHQAAADGLVASGARQDGRLSLVGHHLAEAGKRLAAAACYDEAARQTARRGAFSDALVLTERGLSVLGDDPDPSPELLGLTMTTGNALLAAVGMNAPGLYELWQRCEAIAETLGDHLEQSSGMNGQSLAALIDGKYELAIERAQRILVLGDALPDRVASLRAHCSLALPQLYEGRVGESLAHAKAAIELYRDGDYDLVTYGFGTDQLTIAQTTAGVAEFFAGGSDAPRYLDAGIEHARAIGSPISEALALTLTAMVLLFDEQAEAALDHATRAIEVCDRYDMPFYRLIVSLARAAALGRLGRPDAAEQAHQALEAAGASGDLGLTLGLYMVALCEASCGQFDAAADIARMGVDVARTRDEHVVLVELLSVEHRCRPSDRITEELRDAVAGARGRGAHGSARHGERQLADLSVGTSAGDQPQ